MPGDVLIAIGTEPELKALEDLFAPGPLGRLARSPASRRRSAELAGAEVSLERPKDPAHGDYATNVALQAARNLGRSPREIAEELAEKVVELPEIERAEVAGPGFLNLCVTDAFLGEALAEIDPGYGGGFAEPDAGSRSRWSPPTRPGRSPSPRPGTAPSGTASRACSSSPATTSRASTTTTTQARRWSASAARSRPCAPGRTCPRTATRAPTSRASPPSPATRCPRMLEQIEATLERFRIHFDSWAKQSELEHELERSSPGCRPTSTTARSSSARPISATRRTGFSIRSAAKGGLPTYEAADVAYLRDKLDRGFDRAIYVLGADHHGVAGWYEVVARMLGYDPDRIEVLLYQLVHLTRGGEQTKMSKRRGDVVFLDEFIDEVGVDFARWFLVDRGHDQTIEIDVDLAAGEVAQEPGLLRAVRARADQRDLPRGARRRRRSTPGRACRSSPRSASS